MKGRDRERAPSFINKSRNQVSVTWKSLDQDKPAIAHELSASIVHSLFSEWEADLSFQLNERGLLKVKDLSSSFEGTSLLYRINGRRLEC